MDWKTKVMITDSATSHLLPCKADQGDASKNARTEKAGLPAQATSTNLLPELRYINKFSAH